MFAARAIVSGAASVFKQQLGVPKKKLLQLLQAAVLLALAALAAAAVWRITRIGAEFNNVALDSNNNSNNKNNANAIVDRDFDGGDVDFKDGTTKKSKMDKFGWVSY